MPAFLAGPGYTRGAPIRPPHPPVHDGFIDWAKRMSHVPAQPGPQPAMRANPLGQHGPFTPQPKRKPFRRKPIIEIQVIDMTSERCPLGPDGLTWRNQLPLRILDAEREREGLVTPHGFAEAWHTITFKDRNTEIAWLAQSQARELAPLTQELAANGIGGVSLSSSSDDDDFEAANISEKKTRRVALDPAPDELALRLRDYEFDQFLQKGGQAAKIYRRRSKNDPNTMVTASNDRRMGPDDLRPYKDKLIDLQGDRTIDDLENDRIRASYYGKPVWTAMTPEEQAAWTHKLDMRPDPTLTKPEQIAEEEHLHRIAISVREYINCAEIIHDRDTWMPYWIDQNGKRRFDEEQPEGGPSELGLHWLDKDVDPLNAHYDVMVEPSEQEFWPL